MRRLLAQPGRFDAIPVDATMLSAPIERADGTRVTDLRSRGSWKEVTFSADDGVDPETSPLLNDLYAEEHHRSYWHPWLAGRYAFDFLLSRGLAPGDRVLDVGCGAGRVGVWVAAHLEADRYFGVDPHLLSLVAFSAYEMRLHGLAAKRPRLLHDADFRFDTFGIPFDVALDCDVSRHLSPGRCALMYARLRAALAPGGRVISRSFPRVHDAILRDEGFVVADECEIAWPLPPVRHGGSRTDRWRILRLAGPSAT